MKFTAMLVFCALMLALPPACSPNAVIPAQKNTVLLLAAASTAEPLQQAVDAFRVKHPQVQVNVSTGSTPLLVKQSDTAHLLLAAHPSAEESLRQFHRVTQSVPLLSNRMVLVVPVGNPAGVRSLKDLATDRVKHLALAGEHVPAGIYAEQALRKAGLLEQLQSQGKLVRGGDVRSAAAYVARGEAEAGIAYATDPAAVQGIEVVLTIDRKSHEPIVYPLLLLAANEGAADATKLYDFLRSPEGLKPFLQAGFSRCEKP